MTGIAIRGTRSIASILVLVVMLCAGTSPLASQQAEERQPPPSPKSPGFLTDLLHQVVKQIATARPNPTIHLSSNNSSPVTGQSVSVTAIWSHPVSQPSYTFDWGDGSSPSNPSASAQEEHVYTRSGTFTVVVRATALFDDRSVPATSLLNLSVTQAPETPPQPTGIVPPPARQSRLTLHASTRSAVPGRPIEFTVAVEPARNIPQFRYFFDDGDSAGTIGPNGIAHAYTTSGIHSAYVTTAPGTDVPATASAPISIRIVSATLPTLTLTPITPTPISGDEVIVSASLDPPDSTASYSFNWGDGSPAEAVGPLGDGRHIYSSPGSYPVAVIARINGGRNTKPIAQRLTLSVAGSTNWLIPAAFAGLAALVGAGCFAFRPRVHAVYRLTTQDQPRISFPATAPHASISFRPGELPSQHSIRF